MKQVTQNFRTGELSIDKVPAPVLSPGGILVRTHYSLISAGTEGGTVRLAKQGLVGKARARPDLVRKVLKTVKTQGLVTTYQAVTTQLDVPLAHGYSAAGEVIAAGEDVDTFKIGDRVACIGANHAFHAEIIAVPRNLAVVVPDSVSLRDASFAALGTIALNGMRRAEVSLGDNVLVIGLGLLGQLTVQLLRAAGCRVVGVDIDADKVELARQSGAQQALLRGDPNVVEAVTAFSQGNGVDATIITAVAPDNDPIALAGQVTRQAGTVVAVGRVPYELPRDEYLFKELDFRTAFNSGAGVNDLIYEEHGIDYPISQARWTMNRNMSAFNNLLAMGAVKLDHLVTHEFSIDQAKNAYALVAGQSNETSVGIVFTYNVHEPLVNMPITTSARPKPRTAKQTVGVGVIGAGSHATTFLIPILAKHANAALRGVASGKGVKAKGVADKYHFTFAGTPEQVIADPEMDCVFIATRHDSHAALTIAALEAGKDVFIEKPLALTHEELDAVIAAQTGYGGRIMVGHNRRFSGYATMLKNRFETRGQPLSIIYRYNPGPIRPSAWLRDPALGGGRIIGEGCHFVDFCQFLVGAEPVQVFTQSVHGQGEVKDEEHVMINVNYADGSMAVIAYLSAGDGTYTQERIEAFADGTVAVLEDWRRLEISKDAKVEKKGNPILNDKGFKNEVNALLHAIATGEDLPFSFTDYAISARTTLLALDSLRANQPLKVQHER